MLRFCLPMGLFFLLLTGCSLTAPPQPQPALFDLGLPAAPDAGKNAARREEKQPASPVAVEVRAPSWLRTRVMQYRLAYQEENRRRAYAESRWAAEPAEMIALALERALAGSPGCRLRLSLDELIQVFESPQQSHTLLLLRAEARREGGETARRDFRIRMEAPSPDAAGGVAAGRAALARLAVEIDAWLAATDFGPTP